MNSMSPNALAAVPGYIYSTETFGTVDGPGIRYVFFLQGCPLRCLYCHNPDAIPGQGGEEWTAGRAVDEAMRYHSFIKDGGVTFSGGEPLMQPRFIEASARLLHAEGLHVALDTSGCVEPARVESALRAVDLLLLDIKAWDMDTCTRLTGRGNENAFATLDWCEENGKPVWIRHVLLQGYTLDEGQLTALASKLSRYTCVERVELLPFHKLGEPKWERVPWRYTLAGTPPTTKEQAAAARAIFVAKGLTVQ